ncbi:MAG: formate--tetrahydrofolate ligase, partial [Lachnospiraceae bacterium]|nr:formate--tetrahydrofolate ligase [Lachnospiraceae bacterium]
GPFANIAHGCNSVIATRTGLKLADYCITEAGFGADLGAEKFLDIKCPMAGLKPSAVVLVATIRALKYNGGVKKEDLGSENLDALKDGISNLEAHIDNIHKFGLPVVVALNRFATDTEAEISFVENFCKERDCGFSLSEVFAKGGEGGIDLAEKVLQTLETKKADYKPVYDMELPAREKIETIAKKIDGASEVAFSSKALSSLKKIEDLGYRNMPVCMAKTQYSLSDDPSLLGRPKSFTLNVRDVYVSAGAGFIVALTGDIMTMPGLPKTPAAMNIDVNEEEKITGLF